MTIKDIKEAVDSFLTLRLFAHQFLEQWLSQWLIWVTP